MSHKQGSGDGTEGAKELILAEELVKICRMRWEIGNKIKRREKYAKYLKKQKEKMSHIGYSMDKKQDEFKFKSSCDDISAIVALLSFKEEKIDLGTAKGKKGK